VRRGVPAFVVGGVGLMGVLPSGGYLAKELLLEAAAGTGQWWWAVVMQAGGLFTTGYVVLVLAHSLSPTDEPVRLRAPIPRVREAAALALAVCSLLLAVAAFGPVPRDTLANALAPEELWSAVVLVLGGPMLAIALGRRLPRVRTGEGAVTIVRAVA